MSMLDPVLVASGFGTGQYAALDYGLILLFVLVVILILLWRVIIPYWVRQRQSAVMDGGSWVEDRAWNQIQAGNGLADFLEREGLKVVEARSLLEQALGKYEMKRYGEAHRLAKEASDLLAAQRKKSKIGGTLPSSAETSSKEEPLASAKGSVPIAAPTASEPEAPVYRDVARRVGDPEPDEAPPRATTSSIASTSSFPFSPASSGAGGRRAPSMQGRDEPGEATPPEDENETVAARQKLPKNYMEARFMLSSLQADLQVASPEVFAGP
jgi:hypothetical protein